MESLDVLINLITMIPFILFLTSCIILSMVCFGSDLEIYSSFESVKLTISELGLKVVNESISPYDCTGLIDGCDVVRIESEWLSSWI